MRRRLDVTLALTVSLAVVVVAGACSDDGGSVEAFCATARRMAEDNPAAVFDRYDPSDPTAAVAELREAGTQLRAWADQGPGGVGDDVETIADAAEELAVAFESPAPSPERVAELEARFADVEDASARVIAFTRQRCAVDLDTPSGGGDLSSTTTTPTTTTPTTGTPTTATPTTTATP